MKTKLYSSIVSVFLLLATFSFAQAPDGMNYQAVVRDGAGDVIASQNILMRFTVRTATKDGAVEYQEDKTIPSNQYGMINHVIGTGNVLQGTFAGISWSSDLKFLQVEMNSLSGYISLDTTQLVSVPYALSARTADALTSGSSTPWITSGNDIYYSTGNVGIGTSSPQNKIQVNGDGAGVGFASQSGEAFNLSINADGQLQFGANSIILSSSSIAMTIDDDNQFLGIGTSSPSVPLDIARNGSSSISNFAYYNNTGAPAVYPGTQNLNDISFKAVGRVVASEFDAISDARIKNIIGLTDNNNDLKTLLKIEITDYKFKDELEKGSKISKKVIAQQVEKVYPNAVNVSTNVIPDIFSMAEIKKGIIEVNNELKVGDKVKLVFKDGDELAEVLAADAKSFKVNLMNEGKVFVYGKEVKDFRTVDYDAISMLNVSATQQLNREIEELKALLNVKSNELETLKADLASIKTKLGLDLQGMK